jgi:competence CoiA-like predicted nuclease
MIWALENNNEKILAEPNKKARCPNCKEKVISKCGNINIWHWAHKNSEDCDSWSEGETQWHIDWKNNFPEENQEIIVGKHRADIKTKNGLVIEFQNSSISSEEIKERENYYGEMIWLLNGDKFCNNFKLRKKGEVYTFRWRHPRKCWWNSNKEIYIDMNNYFFESFDQEIREPYIEHPFIDKILLIKKLYSNIPCGGWGKIISKEEFLKTFK